MAAYTYNLHGRLLHASSGDPIRCAAVDLVGEVTPGRYGFPASGRGKTDADGQLRGEMMTWIAWGSCGPAFYLPPFPPELSAVDLSPSGSQKWSWIAATAAQQRRVDRTKGEIDLGEQRLEGFPPSRCD